MGEGWRVGGGEGCGAWNTNMDSLQVLEWAWQKRGSNVLEGCLDHNAHYELEELLIDIMAYGHIKSKTNNIVWH